MAPELKAAIALISKSIATLNEKDCKQVAEKLGALAYRAEERNEMLASKEEWDALDWDELAAISAANTKRNN